VKSHHHRTAETARRSFEHVGMGIGQIGVTKLIYLTLLSKAFEYAMAVPTTAARESPPPAGAHS